MRGIQASYETYKRMRSFRILWYSWQKTVRKKRDWNIRIKYSQLKVMAGCVCAEQTPGIFTNHNRICNPLIKIEQYLRFQLYRVDSNPKKEIKGMKFCSMFMLDEAHKLERLLWFGTWRLNQQKSLKSENHFSLSIFTLKLVSVDSNCIVTPDWIYFYFMASFGTFDCLETLLAFFTFNCYCLTMPFCATRRQWMTTTEHKQPSKSLSNLFKR